MIMPTDLLAPLPPDGITRLVDRDILALLLASDRAHLSGSRRAARLLARFGSLRGLVAAAAAPVTGTPEGLARREALRLMAARELVRRSLLEEARESDAIASPEAVRDFLRLSIADREREVFAAIYLDNRHRVLAVEELFQGTLTQTSVHPREVVRAALRHNAAAAIVAHNHPSGLAEPSQADRLLTTQLRATLAQVDVRLLDHFIVTGHAAVSFAERGWL
jgi:DNA repair protein RadC